MTEGTPKQYAGVWFDNHHATIVTHDTAAKGLEFFIKEKLEADVYQGEKGEHTKNNADRSNSLKYFKSMSRLLVHFDEIYIFGPGKAQEELVNFLVDDSHFKSKKISIDSAKQMSDKQLIAKVREFFSAN
ncbi:MAG: hypothetical protein ABIV51_07635 [Saprospiraceae bacterium]